MAMLRHGLSWEEKQSFYDELKGDWDMRSSDDLVVGISNFNVHSGRHIVGIDSVHGGYGVGQRNLEGRMLQEFCLEKKLDVKYIV